MLLRIDGQKNFFGLARLEIHLFEMDESAYRLGNARLGITEIPEDRFRTRDILTVYEAQAKPQYSIHRRPLQTQFTMPSEFA